MSITTVQLFHRLGRMTRGGDFTKLSMTEQTDLAQAATAGLQQVYDLLPVAFREMTEGFLLPAPLAVSVALTSGSADVPTSTFTAAQIGRSVVFSGDENWNQVVDTNKLLNPYLGASGTVAGTVYGDAISVTRYPFDRIIGNPRFPNQGSTLSMNPNLRPTNDSSGWWIYAQSIGTPLYWWTQPLGNSQGKTPLLVLKFSPAPSRQFAVDVRLSFWPKRLTLADYDNATDIVAPDEVIEAALIPIALQALTLTPIWDKQYDPRRFDEAADRGRALLRNKPGQIATPNNRVGTPFGY
jgi:hypothetical protein